ncbi:MAG: helix-turn-helix transcriptional regulator [Actinomycetota bacterium]|nr:helix-turn-helix transcriptional regulator [Actinomycetota bacterium]MDK1038989.1 helix-turn-helix transcriptional regulator [Actinomycetota bacterium]MDK1102611.1 helix-turn-helix transcriptional regulator [Actinomycetota bacterium]
MMTGILQILGQQRRDQGMSLAELARRSGIPRPNLSRIERGLTDPRVSTVERMMSALDLQIDVVERRPLDLQGVLDRASRGNRILASCGIESSDPWRRIGRRAALGDDVSAEARVLAASESHGR